MKTEPMAETTETTPTDSEREATLLREALGLFEQKRYREALLACEGVLVIKPNSVLALSLKGALHERLGEIPEAIRTYERVLELNPLSVSERVRLETLRAQMVGRTAPPAPLWKEALPVVMAFLGSSLILIVGLVLVLRMSAPAPDVPNPVAEVPTESRPSAPQATIPRPPVEPSETPPTASSAPSPTPPNGAVPPVMIDPSRVALTPAPDSGLRGSIPPAPPSAPENDGRMRSNENRTEREQQPASPPNRSEVMPDVSVRETEQRGVYEVRVYPQNGGNSANRNARSNPTNDALKQAQEYQKAGNYSEALNAYRQALAQAEFKGDILQQMAICHLRLGDKANARQHFLQAINEYERQIQQGYEVENARQGILACQNGLRLCEE